MAEWYFSREDIENASPSRIHGLSLDGELKLRKEGARLIMEAGHSLQLSVETIATGVVLFHRFYMFCSFTFFPHRVVAAACLFLSGKIEETPKKCRDILRTLHSLIPEAEFVAGFGADPKETLLVHERILLQTIKFDLQIANPYSTLMKFAKALIGDRVKIQKVVQMAWTFVNDSLCTTLCLQWEPHLVAVAVLQVAASILKVDLQMPAVEPGKPWWSNFVPDVDSAIIQEVGRQVLSSYEPGHPVLATVPGTVSSGASPNVSFDHMAMPSRGKT